MSYGSKFDQEEVAKTYQILCKINRYFTPERMPDVEAFLYHLECVSRTEGMSGDHATFLRTFGYVLTPYLYAGDKNDVRYKLSIDVSVVSDFLGEK